MERTDTCWSGFHLRLDTIRAPWQLILIVGATSAEGLSSLERFTNIFTAIRTSFRLKGAEDANSSPLGREDQDPNPSIRASRINSTKGQVQVFGLYTSLEGVVGRPRRPGGGEATPCAINFNGQNYRAVASVQIHRRPVHAVIETLQNESSSGEGAVETT